MPRTRPSVGCSAMVRTRPSPMCCATSQMMSIGSGTLKPSLVMRIAVWMAGICPFGKLACPRRVRPPESPCRSAPISAMLPYIVYSEAAAPLTTSMISLGDARLADAVHVQRQLVDHFRRVAVAASIAVMRAACSAAADSSMAR